MPCQEEGQSRWEWNRLHERHQEMTDMLCTLCQRLEAGGYGVLLSGRVLEWWQAHQAADVRRQAEEMEQSRRTVAREAAKAKLTPEEQALLKLS